MSHDGPFGIQLQSLLGIRSPSIIEAGSSAFNSRADMDCGVPLGRPEGSQGLISCRAMHVRSHLKPESSVRLPVGLTIGIDGFLSKCHRAVTPDILF